MQLIGMTDTVKELLLRLERMHFFIDLLNYLGRDV